jgi:hypothetical protein
VRLDWSLAVPDFIPLRITREVDGAPEETIDQVFRTEQFLDKTAPLGSLNRNLIYRIYVEGGPETPAATAILDNPRRHPIAAMLTLGERVLLKKHGFPVAWFAVRTTGPRCSCYNEVRGEPASDNCPECKGGGFLIGFADPRLIFMLGESPEQRNVALAEAGELEQSPRSLWTTEDVRLRPRDVLVTASNKRHRVEGIVQHSWNESNTRQVARCSAISPSDIEHDLEIPEAMLVTLRTNPGRARIL